MDSYWNDFSEIYDSREGGKLTPIHREMIDTLFSLNPSITSVLDLGCGTGSLCKTFREHYNGPYYGVDLTQGMLERARDKADLMPIRADISALPFSKSFDLVLSSSVMEFFPDITSILREIRRVMTAGILVITIPQVRFYSPKMYYKVHKKLYLQPLDPDPKIWALPEYLHDTAWFKEHCDTNGFQFITEIQHTDFVDYVSKNRQLVNDYNEASQIWTTEYKSFFLKTI